MLGSLGGAFAAQHDTPWGKVIILTMCVPLGLGIAAAAGRSVTRICAPTFITPWFGRGVGDVFSFCRLTGDIGMIIWHFVALNIVSLVRFVRLLVDSYADSF